MTEVESEVLKSYKDALSKAEGFESELIPALAQELSNDTPNPERLADIIKLKKSA